MKKLRIKVQLGDGKREYQGRRLLHKFIYVIDSLSTKTIGELLQILQEHIIKEFSYSNIQIVQLTTEDGFILRESDLCSAALKDNDHIICVDMKKFAYTYGEFFDINTTIWLERKEYDATNKAERAIRIGLNNISQLFIRLYGTNEVNSIYTFGIYQLMEIANAKQENKLIGHLDNTMEFNPPSPAKWFLECQWDYDADSNTCLFIICSLKIGSSDDIWFGKLQILLDQSRMCIEKGEITHLSGGIHDGTILTTEQCQRLKELVATIPPPKRTGPEISTDTPQNLKLTKYECEGVSSLLMVYGNTNTVQMDQTSSAVEGNFLQRFTITSIVFSKKPTMLPEILGRKRTEPGDKPISVTNLTVYYQIYDSSWRVCQNIKIAPGPFDGRDKWLPDLIINIEPNTLVSFSIKGEMLIKGICRRISNTCNRTHKNLPQPLKLKIVATDSLNKECSLIVEQLNEPLELITFETTKKWRISTNICLALIYADDCDNDNRLFAWMGFSSSNELQIGRFDNRDMSFDRKKFLQLRFEAQQNKTTENHLEKLHYQKDSDEIKATILLDPVTYMAYAVRFEVSTKTSKTEETLPIPMDKIK
ncbi:unnamed protein product [Adineta steineri]|uniref:Uncharacterized protein n=1 Tax=Adineta steineri TaxID=433720 RepID=A0A814MVU3_9BILA|nr:unnamed protein product [Adineta steineri]CAF3994051.1 unnamed protein product [Adineta steineri]